MRILKKVKRRIEKGLWKLSVPSRVKEITASVGSKCTVLIGTPEYCNLGDHLIAYAAVAFIQKLLPGHAVVEITRELYEAAPAQINQLLSRETVEAVFITGGGFLGSLWEQMDDDVLSILSASAGKKVFILPQTIFYEADSQERFAKDRAAFAAVKDLHVFVRDRNSYIQSVTNGLIEKESISLRPDMALYLYPYLLEEQARNGVALCIRQDKENTLSGEQERLLQSFARQVGKNDIEYIETVDKYRSFIPQKRGREILRFSRKVAGKSLVITNRLHCMVFCFITHTPCIAIDNISRKISGVHAWISDCEYIACIEELDMQHISRAYEKIKASVSTKYDESKIKEEFFAMGKEICEGLT